MDQCESILCDREAEYIDQMSNVICEECMLEEIENGDAVPEDFEKLEKD